MSDESLNGDGADEYGPVEDTTPPELRWLDYRDPRVTASPDDYTSMNERSGHTLVAPRCTGRTAAGPRCKGPATMFGEGGKIVCSAHSPLKKEKAKPKRGGSLRDRLRSRADEDYDILEDELLALAQSAMTSKTITCKSCKRRIVVEVADSATRLRAIESVLDRTGASKATAANAKDDLFEGKSTTLEEIQAMSTTDLVKYHDWLLARDADALERMMQAKRDYAATRAEYGSSKVVQMGFRSGSDDRTLRRLYAELHAMFGSDTIAA